MRPRHALLIGAIALGCSAGGAVSGDVHDTVVSPPLPLPQIELRGLDDRPVRLEVAAGGQPALVSFWATWCEACLKEMDALNRLNEHARATGGVVIGVNVGETRDKAAAFVRERGLKYAQLVDEKLTLAEALGQKRLPATLVLDRSGRVVFTGGTLDEEALRAFRLAMSGTSGGAPAP